MTNADWTLGTVFRHHEPELQREIRPTSLAEYRYALKHWTKHAGDPPLAEITKEVVSRFKDRMEASGLSAATAAKTWRYMRAIAGLTRHLPEMSEFHIPELTLRRGSMLFRPDPPRQRETITDAEVDLLWQRAAIATYPMQHATAQWRLWILLLWHYGPRTIDLLHMTWESILWQDNLIRFQARKTNKLQGLPLTSTVSRHLRDWGAVCSYHPGEGGRLFPGFRMPGHFNRRTGNWRMGWRTEWRTVLAALGPVSGGCGPIASPITFKNFRQSCVTRLNDLSPGVGGWVAGHYRKDVTDVSYDRPDQRIRKVFEERVLPACFAADLRDSG